MCCSHRCHSCSASDVTSVRRGPANSAAVSAVVSLITLAAHAIDQEPDVDRACQNALNTRASDLAIRVPDHSPCDHRGV